MRTLFQASTLFEASTLFGRPCLRATVLRTFFDRHCMRDAVWGMLYERLIWETLVVWGTLVIRQLYGKLCMKARCMKNIYVWGTQAWGQSYMKNRMIECCEWLIGRKNSQALNMSKSCKGHTNRSRSLSMTLKSDSIIKDVIWEPRDDVWKTNVKQQHVGTLLNTHFQDAIRRPHCSS